MLFSLSTKLFKLNKYTLNNILINCLYKKSYSCDLYLKIKIEQFKTKYIKKLFWNYFK